MIRGGGGTGKSYAINCFRRWLSEQMLFSDENIAVLAPTGTAAFNVAGRTLHSALKLPVPLNQSTFQKLTSGNALTSLQETFRNVRVVVIDEMSMVGRRLQLRIYCRQEDYFIVFGDFPSGHPTR